MRVRALRQLHGHIRETWHGCDAQSSTVTGQVSSYSEFCYQVEAGLIQTPPRIGLSRGKCCFALTLQNMRFQEGSLVDSGTGMRSVLLRAP